MGPSLNKDIEGIQQYGKSYKIKYVVLEQEYQYDTRNCKGQKSSRTHSVNILHERLVFLLYPIQFFLGRFFYFPNIFFAKCHSCVLNVSFIISLSNFGGKLLMKSAIEQNSISPIEAGFSRRQDVISGALAIRNMLYAYHRSAIVGFTGNKISNILSINGRMSGRNKELPSVIKNQMNH